LSRYPDLTPTAYFAELYALEGMAEVMLAEFYCSGIPLTNTPFQQNFQYTGALSTTEVLNQAIAHFDTALTYHTDSVPVLTLINVGKGRALLDLGQYTDAATAVQDVATDAQYVVTYNATGFSNQIGFATLSQYPRSLLVTDKEGRNGMQWGTTPQDPRVPLQPDGLAYDQIKYGQDTPMILASGIEARLIEAEAQLHAKDYTAWLATLTALDAEPGIPGSGGLSGVPAPADPGSVDGSDSARVSMLFRERAFWLFLTGHRQGDLRRLVRQYGRDQSFTYPIGAMVPSNTYYPLYGSRVNAAPPLAEQQQNYLYKGCLDRNA
jgi:hypothetical protein